MAANAAPEAIALFAQGDDRFPGRHFAAHRETLDLPLQGGEVVLDPFRRLADRAQAADHLFMVAAGSGQFSLERDSCPRQRRDRRHPELARFAVEPGGDRLRLVFELLGTAFRITQVGDRIEIGAEVDRPLLVAEGENGSVDLLDRGAPLGERPGRRMLRGLERRTGSDQGPDARHLCRIGDPLQRIGEWKIGRSSAAGSSASGADEAPAICRTTSSKTLCASAIAASAFAACKAASRWPALNGAALRSLRRRPAPLR
jgi:hypothetical protein